MLKYQFAEPADNQPIVVDEYDGLQRELRCLQSEYEDLGTHDVARLVDIICWARDVRAWEVWPKDSPAGSPAVMLEMITGVAFDRLLPTLRILLAPEQWSRIEWLVNWLVEINEDSDPRKLADEIVGKFGDDYAAELAMDIVKELKA